MCSTEASIRNAGGFYKENDVWYMLLFCVVFASIAYSMKKLKKEDLMDTLRNENL